MPIPQLSGIVAVQARFIWGAVRLVPDMLELRSDSRGSTVLIRTFPWKGHDL